MKSEDVKQMATTAIETLAAALEAGKSDDLKRYLAAMELFHRYSLHNVMLIALQKPTASHDGIVHSSLKPRCIGCSNCVLACPFGIPKIFPEYEQMIKCDMCYDRTSVGKKPMCATVCPSQALSYVRPEEIAKRREKPNNVFQFGNQKIVTRVHMMVPAETDAVSLDVLDYMWEESYVGFSQPQ